ncbi:MAG: hypothetical protein L0Z62_30585 [Gemmataceae bacterium]|nr:hypothetical protein [Gemmataceae bacterium]
MITALHLPASGPNLVSDDGSRFEGLCNLIYVDFKETGEDGAYVAKGSLYYFGTVTNLAIREERPNRVVFDVEGKGGNQVAPKADVVQYRQRYTLLPDRIICDGELEWLFDEVVPDSHPELIQFQCLFAPGAVAGELRAWDADTEPKPLLQLRHLFELILERGQVVPVPEAGQFVYRIRRLSCSS